MARLRLEPTFESDGGKDHTRLLIERVNVQVGTQNVVFVNEADWDEFTAFIDASRQQVKGNAWFDKS